ncbi:MAG: histidine phosphatase family protein, partial [Pseudomonadota bacterium]|nr:histidine phosphatase family protein [Pseudomonadota bacterium]
MTLYRPLFRPMRRPMMRLVGCLFLVWIFALPMRTGAQAGEQAGALAEAIGDIDADVLFLRHALAPGFGDPASFRIDDCRTQRNLSQAGRDQSRRIGDYLRGEGLDIGVILSSRWCRCVETAAEMAMGPFTIHDGLNSFFDGHVDRGETLTL